MSKTRISLKTHWYIFNKTGSIFPFLSTLSLKLPKFNKELSNSSKFYATGLFKSDKLKTDWSVSTSLSTSKSLKYLCETFLHSVAKWPFTSHLCQLQFLYAQSLAM